MYSIIIQKNKENMKKVFALILGASLMANAFSQERNALELVTVKGATARSGVGIPVYQSAVKLPGALSVWVMTGGGVNLSSDVKRISLVRSDEKLYLGAGLSRAIWQSSTGKYSFNVVGGWSAGFDTLTSPRDAEWALGASLGIRY